MILKPVGNKGLAVQDVRDPPPKVGVIVDIPTFCVKVKGDPAIAMVGRPVIENVRVWVLLFPVTFEAVIV